MKRAVVAAVVLSLAASVSAQERRHHGSPRPPAEVVPPSRIVPPVLSTRLPTILPPPPPPSPFAARPGTYAPRFDRLPRVHGSTGVGLPFYDNSALSPAPETSVPDSNEAPSPAPSRVIEPSKAAEPSPEPPKPAEVHGPDLFYVIPGCYAGNRPPIPERLPKGCDLAKLRTMPIR